MSVPATTAVWEHSKATGSDLLLMLAIADAANADGCNAYPGVDRLCKWCRKSKRAVLASIERQVKAGELVRTTGGHRGQRAVYDVVLPGLESWTIHHEKGAGNDTQSARERVQETGGKGEGGDPKGCSKPATAPLIGTIGTTNDGDERAFEEFWTTYPERHGRKLSKGKALEQWRKLAAHDRAAALVAVRHYRAACAKGETLAKDAFRWLRDRSFEDWIEPPKAEGRHRPPPPADTIRCTHGYPVTEDDDGWFSPCGKCDQVDLERAAVKWRRERAS